MQGSASNNDISNDVGISTRSKGVPSTNANLVQHTCHAGKTPNKAGILQAMEDA